MQPDEIGNLIGRIDVTLQIGGRGAVIQSIVTDLLLAPLRRFEVVELEKPLKNGSFLCLEL